MVKDAAGGTISGVSLLSFIIMWRSMFVAVQRAAPSGWQWRLSFPLVANLLGVELVLIGPEAPLVAGMCVAVSVLTVAYLIVISGPISQESYFRMFDIPATRRNRYPAFAGRWVVLVTGLVVLVTSNVVRHLQ